MNPLIYSVSDIAIGALYFILLLAVGFVIRNRNKNDPSYKWFIPNLIFKMFFSVFFGFTFIKILGYGGDTVAYFDSVEKLVNLLFQNPSGYFKELTSTPTVETMSNNFTASTGYPPGWIYREPESFFVAKILSLFGVFTFKSFIALSLVCAFIAAIGSFRFYQIVRKYELGKDRYVAIATMFIPTVCFWCSAATKDMLILAVFYLALYQIFAFFDEERKFGFSNILLLLILMYILFEIRAFMLYAIVPPLLLSFGLGNINRMKNKLFSGLIKFVFFAVSVAGAFVILSSDQGLAALGGEEYLEEMAIIQQDFAENQTYGGPRYDLGVTDFSTTGMIAAAPLAIITAIYRPFLWEAEGPLLLLSALEGLVFVLLTLRFLFLKGGGIANFRFVFSNELLTFALTFALFFSFFVGFTSILFNVLVRFKAPILGFLVLVLIADKKIKAQNAADKTKVKLEE